MTPPWKPSLQKALKRSQDAALSRLLQLATVRVDGTPANRTVVFRGFQPGNDALQFITDSRGTKLSEINQCPWAEACWYFSEVREQFRLSGKLTPIGPENAIEEYRQARTGLWENSSTSIREMFFWPKPGTPRGSGEHIPVSGLQSASAPDNFTLLILEPTRVDHLDLNQLPHSRVVFLLEDWGKWSKSIINP